MARDRRLFGTVQMEAAVNEHGSVTNVRIVNGDPILAQAAKTAVLKWKYKPATLNGKAISTSLFVKVSFQDGPK